MSERNPALMALYIVAGLTFAGGCGIWLVQTILPAREDASLSQIADGVATSAQMLVLAIALIAVGVLAGIAALHASAIARATYNAAWTDDGR
ncbi:hypothetical protein ACLBWJ_12975 [Microbacterium sp. M4A5_1d]